MSSGEIQYAEMFVFTDNMVFEIVLYKGMSKITFLFEIVLRFHQVQMGGDLILHVFHITGTRMTKSGIDGILRGNNMGGMVRGVSPLKCIPLDKGVMEILTGV